MTSFPFHAVINIEKRITGLMPHPHSCILMLLEVMQAIPKLWSSAYLPSEWYIWSARREWWSALHFHDTMQSIFTFNESTCEHDATASLKISCCQYSPFSHKLLLYLIQEALTRASLGRSNFHLTHSWERLIPQSDIDICLLEQFVEEYCEATAKRREEQQPLLYRSIPLAYTVCGRRWLKREFQVKKYFY